MALEIDDLQVRITANANTATSALKSLSGALKSVKTQLTGVNKGGLSVSDRLSKSLNDMNGALNSINTGSIKKLQKLANALNDYSSALKRTKSLGSSIKEAEKVLSGGVFDAASDVNVDKFAEAMGEMQSLKVVGITAESTGESAEIQQKIRLFDRVRDVFHKIGDSLKGLKDKLKLSNTAFGKFVKSIGRIAFYRAIRSALKGISEAFSEGLKSAYGYSKQSETFKRLADTLDRIKSITSQMVNQLGAFFGEIKQFLLPAIEWIVDKVRFVAEYLTELFAAINGEDTYLQAQYVAKEWDESIGKVKEYKHQLLGLDELNNLSDPKKTGAKADEEDYSKYYNEVPVDSKMKRIGGTISEFILRAKDALFKWEGVTEDDIENKIQAGLLAIAGGVIGGVPGALIGYAAGIALTMIVDKLNPAEPGREKYSETTFYKILIPALTGLAGGVLGAKFGLKGAVVTATISAALGLTLVQLLESKKKGKKYKGQALFDVLYPGLYGLAGAIIGSQYLGIKGALVGLSIGATVGFILKSFDPAEAKAQLGDSVLFNMLEPALSTLTGAWIGWKLGSKMAKPVEGALLGASIGLMIGLLLHAFDPAENRGATATGVINSLIPLLNGLAVGLLVFAATGNTSAALMSLSIAVSLSFILQSIDWSSFKKAAMEKINAGAEAVSDALSVKVADGKVELNPLAGVAKEVQTTTASGIEKSNSGTKRSTWDAIKESVGELYDNSWLLKDTVEDTKKFFTDAGNTIKDSQFYQEVSGFVNNVKSFFGKKNKGGLFDGSSLKAHGGTIPANGSLFWAGEAGAEFVGNIGSTSAVANTGQMTEAIYKAAYMGMSKALKENGGGGMNGFEPATTDDLFIAMRKKASNYNKMTGNSAFA